MGEKAGSPEALEAVWGSQRGRLLDIAYRLLGSRVEAEDVVSEAYLRLTRHGLAGIDDPVAWLVTVTGRLGLDRLRSAEVARRTYVGPWLPEPILGDADAFDLADRVTLDDSVRMALLIVLEQLSAAERTVFVLADVFGVDFSTVAEIVGRTPAACRQLAVRARARIEADGNARFEADPVRHREVVDRFVGACQSGDLEALVAVLHDDVAGDFDSGGAIRGAPLVAAVGPTEVGTLLHRAFAGSNAAFTVESVNGEPGGVVRLEGQVVAVISVGVRDALIVQVHGIGNPDKLPAT